MNEHQSLLAHNRVLTSAKKHVCLHRSEDAGTAQDNAASALGKVLEHHANVMDTGPLVMPFLNALPLHHDLAEAHVAHAQLVRFLEKSDPR